MIKTLDIYVKHLVFKFVMSVKCTDGELPSEIHFNDPNY